MNTQDLPTEPRSPGNLAQNAFLVFAPPLGVLVAAILCWRHGLGWSELAAFGLLYAISGLGITTGFHRLFSHKAFKTTASLRYALAVAGSLSAQGSLLWWVAEHRQHHRTADAPGDPHSPHLHGDGRFPLLRGLSHAHMGWMFDWRSRDLMRQIPDLLADTGLVWIDRLNLVWIALGFLLPAIVCGLIAGSWMGALQGFVWGGLVRMFVVNHVTWSVNSICHTYGRRDFRAPDKSTNQPIVAVLAIGEGWHNNHHAFPNSARHGLLKWQVDPTYWLIRVLEAAGLVWDVRTPSSEAMAARRLTVHAPQSTG
jgi:stearoyl-CoA desaturase (delta-9 desaturase)